MRSSDWSSDVCSSDLLMDASAACGLVALESSMKVVASMTATGVLRWPPTVNDSRPASTASGPTPIARHSAAAAKAFNCRSEERRVGKECVIRVDLGGRRIIKKKTRY